MIAMTQDILLILLPFLSSSDATALFELVLSAKVLSNSDNGVQKRGYKILSRLVDSDRAVLNIEDVLHRLEVVSDGLASAAKKVSLSYYFPRFRMRGAWSLRMES
jgi:ribosomal RNA-processing protein 12